MNENLSERLGRSRSAFRPAVDQVQVLILPPRLNEKIREYFEQPGMPITVGHWASRPEIPTSQEVLDEDSSSTDGSTAGSSDVMIVPNKKKGAWESKGKATHSRHSYAQRSDSLHRSVPLRSL